MNPLLFTLFLCLSTCNASPETYTITISDSFAPFFFFVDIYYSLLPFAIEDINNDPTILPNTNLTVEVLSQFGSPAAALAQMIQFDQQNKTFIVGSLFSSISIQTGIAGTVFDIAQLSLGATTSVLSDKRVYPYFSRMVPANNHQVDTLVAAIEYYSSIEAGWDNVGVVASTNEYGIDISENFIAKSKNVFEIATFQQIIVRATTYEVEIRELISSKARVFATFILNTDFEGFLIAANDAGLIGDDYVWFTGDLITFQEPTSEIANDLMRGLIAAVPFRPEFTPQYGDFLDRWSDAELPRVTEESKAGYDAFITAALTIDAMDKLGRLEEPRIKGEDWADTLRSITFDGISGPVKFNENGDLLSDFQLVFYIPTNRTWETAAIYSDEEGTLEFIRNVVFYSGSEIVPDLDIREPYEYWSCHDKEMKVDPTGKSVKLHSPGSKDIDNIESGYYCDNFIDCRNLSDESSDCPSNYLALFITFGIITGILLFICASLFVFVVIFGIFLGYRRLRRVSPVVLLILLLCMIIGYCSIFAWFGKPHPVACAFQPWLLAISSNGMIAALCVKTFRIWRIFRKPALKVVISDKILFVLWLCLMAPVLLILVLWSIISTPTATLTDFDGTDHYVCATGGFTGPPGGYIFFALLVAYGAFVLFCGMFLSIVTRNIPSSFNESKLLAVSIYNIGFLAVVIIPVFLVVQQINPFISWILRTVAILYAFTATLVLQFVDPLIGIILLDKCKNLKRFESLGRSTSPPSAMY